MAGRKVTLIVMLCAAVLAGACGGGGDDAAPQAAATPTPPTVCPLTGEDPPDSLPRPAIAVKVENSPQARPQTGLHEADVVFEEIVEGGITRFAAVYHCGTSKKVGPVRSARYDDAAIVKPITRALVFSGANDIVLKHLRNQNMILKDEDSTKALFRDPPGSTDVHSLFANIERARKEVGDAPGVHPEPGLYEFGDINEGAKRAKRVTLNFTESVTIEYRWRVGAWRRFEDGQRFVVRPGGQIAVPNVLVQEVRVNRSKKLFDVSGNPSPDIRLMGRGRAFLFRDGSVVTGRWRSDGRSVTTFETRAGEPLRFAEGAIWIELVPSPKGEVKGKVAFR